MSRDNRVSASFPQTTDCYIQQIFRKQAIHYKYALDQIKQDAIIYIRNNIVCFNTGLFTPKLRNIYMVFEKIKRMDAMRQWYFKALVDESSPLLLETAVEMARRDWSLAVPQAFQSHLQFLLPMYLTRMDRPDLTMALSVMDGYYIGHTCLTLEMSYQNLRLLARLTARWLTELVEPESS